MGHDDGLFLGDDSVQRDNTKNKEDISCLCGHGGIKCFHSEAQPQRSSSQL